MVVRCVKYIIDKVRVDHTLRLSELPASRLSRLTRSLANHMLCLVYCRHTLKWLKMHIKICQVTIFDCCIQPGSFLCSMSQSRCDIRIVSCVVVVETGVPTSVDFVQCEPTQMVVAYTSANAYVFDIEKCKPVVTLDYKPSLGIVICYCSLWT